MYVLMRKDIMCHLLIIMGAPYSGDVGKRLLSSSTSSHVEGMQHGMVWVEGTHSFPLSWTARLHASTDTLSSSILENTILVYAISLISLTSAVQPLFSYGSNQILVSHQPVSKMPDTEVTNAFCKQCAWGPKKYILNYSQ